MRCGRSTEETTKEERKELLQWPAGMRSIEPDGRRKRRRWPRRRASRIGGVDGSHAPGSGIQVFQVGWGLGLGWRQRAWIGFETWNVGGCLTTTVLDHDELEDRTEDFGIGIGLGLRRLGRR